MTTEQQSREAVVLNHLSAIYPDIEAFYTDLHEHPELSMQEVQTSAKVASRLKGEANLVRHPDDRRATG
jgi:hippurate hydrolase